MVWRVTQGHGFLVLRSRNPFLLVFSLSLSCFSCHTENKKVGLLKIGCVTGCGRLSIIAIYATRRNDRLPVFVFPHASQMHAQRLWSLLFNGGDCNLKPAPTPVPWTGPVSATLIFRPLHQFSVNQRLSCCRVFCFVFDFLFLARNT